MSNSALPPHDKEMTLTQHLLELRVIVTKSIIAIFIMFLILFPFANLIFSYIAEPLTRHLPEGGSMLAVGVISPFLTPFKLSMVLAVYLAMPFLLYQLWKFIAPALYQHEKKLVGPLLFFSSFLFYAGGAFAYYVVFPLVFAFMSQTAPDGVAVAPDIAMYLSFVIKMFFAFGIAFEVPIVTVLLIITGMIKVKTLSHSRPYIIVGSFVIGMLLTPPDIISQTLLAIPIWLLYELGLIVGSRIIKNRQETTEEEQDIPDETAQATGQKKQSTQKEPEQKTQKEQSAKQAEEDEEFDNRYADQVDDDFDYDAEFDRIDQEMAKMHQEADAKKSDKQQDDQEENQKDKPQNSDKSDDKPEDPTKKTE